jgi:hypothetical protein
MPDLRIAEFIKRRLEISQQLRYWAKLGRELPKKRKILAVYQQK